MTDWAAIQAGAYSSTTKKAKALSELIINSKLSRPELESVSFIIQLEIMKRKAHKESKKIIHLGEYKGQHQGQAQGPEQAAPPEGQGAESAAGAFLGDQQQGQGPGSAAAAPPEGGQES